MFNHSLVCILACMEGDFSKCREWMKVLRAFLLSSLQKCLCLFTYGIKAARLESGLRLKSGFERFSDLLAFVRGLISILSIGLTKYFPGVSAQ